MANGSRVGTASLLAAVGGAAATHGVIASGVAGDPAWLHVLAGGFEAAVVGGLADWFAVTALFRHPLGLPIPHTAIIPTRRAKIIESIVTMVEEEWLSPEVIGERLRRLAPSEMVLDWLSDPSHLERLAHPIRDVLRSVARALDDEAAIDFVSEVMRSQVRDAPLDAAAGRLLARALASDGATTAFAALATSLANVAERPRTAVQLHWWLDRSARTLREHGKRMVPFLLRREVVQRAIVDAACGWASVELRQAAKDAEHPVRVVVLRAVRRFAEKVQQGDPKTLGEVERWRAAVADAVDLEPVVRHVLSRLRARIERDLDDPDSALARLIRRELSDGVRTLLEDPARRETFDQWVRATADDLLRRHHHQIGRTVRENLEALDTGALVAQIEARVGSDLQYIRLNGAVVGGLIGLGLATLRWAMG